MLIVFNENVQYSFIDGTNLCTIYTKPSHALKDVLDCKKHIRKLNSYVIFRDTVHIKNMSTSKLNNSY